MAKGLTTQYSYQKAPDQSEQSLLNLRDSHEHYPA